MTSPRASIAPKDVASVHTSDAAKTMVEVARSDEIMFEMYIVMDLRMYTSVVIIGKFLN